MDVCFPFDTCIMHQRANLSSSVFQAFHIPQFKHHHLLKESKTLYTSLLKFLYPHLSLSQFSHPLAPFARL